jgi:hypothetical protein
MREWENIDPAPAALEVMKSSDLLDQRPGRKKLLDCQPTDGQKERGLKQLQLAIEPRATRVYFHLGGYAIAALRQLSGKAATHSRHVDPLPKSRLIYA